MKEWESDSQTILFRIYIFDPETEWRKGASYKYMMQVIIN